MNYYERIQKALNYIELNISDSLRVEDVAREAFMSVSHFYRLFFALTGHTVSEYIRNRKLAEASVKLRTTDLSILHIALDFGFTTHESFSRAFHKTVGTPPKEFRKTVRTFCFERMNVMEKYFDIQDPDLLEKYPDIKVLKELPPLTVASFHYYGKEPEYHAWQLASAWLNKSQLSPEQQRSRFFGFNNPSPASDDQIEYGYEFWITLDDESGDELGITKKTFPGGLYAVTTAKGGGEALPPVWKRLNSWLKDSKYEYGGHQWLEEHLGFDSDWNHSGCFDIYLPIKPRLEKNF